MKLQFLGSGTAFTSLAENYHSNMMVTSESGKHLMIDCGTDARHSTAAINLASKDFDAVYVSHLHADHAGGLEWMAFTRKFDPTASKPKLIIHPLLREPLWENSLSGSLRCIETEDCTLQTYFDLYPFIDDTHFQWEGISFELVKTIHISHNKSPLPNPSYGLFFKLVTTNVFITTDTRFEPAQYFSHYEAADLIFHDCETTPFKSGVHSHFSELCTLPAEIKAKMWLYHYSAAHLPDALKHGFLGFVKRGQSFEFNKKP